MIDYIYHSIYHFQFNLQILQKDTAVQGWITKPLKGIQSHWRRRWHIILLYDLRRGSTPGMVGLNSALLNWQWKANQHDKVWVSAAKSASEKATETSRPQGHPRKSKLEKVSGDGGLKRSLYYIL